jgi:hypothetical protein
MNSQLATLPSSEHAKSRGKTDNLTGTSQEGPATPLHVPAARHSVERVIDPAWAEAIARDLLEEPLPRRWTHVRGVAATAKALAAVLGDATDLIVSASWLHDIGYSPAIAATGFHPLDGARHLRDHHQARQVLCRLVAHHSCAVIEAAERGLDAELLAEFPAPPDDLADALIYCDYTAGPDGQPMSVHQRIAEIRDRYGPGDPVTVALARSEPRIIAAVTRIAKTLDQA